MQQQQKKKYKDQNLLKQKKIPVAMWFELYVK